jgi:transposase
VPTAAVIDSQTVRAADTVPTASSGYDGGKKIKGRKRHVAVDTALREAFSTITLVWADAGYTGRFVRDARKIWDLAVAIVKRSDQAKGFVLLHRRWVVERSFAWLTKFRRLVRDYETLPATHEAMIWTAATWQLSNRLTRSLNSQIAVSRLLDTAREAFTQGIHLSAAISAVAAPAMAIGGASCCASPPRGTDSSKRDRTRNGPIIDHGRR